MAEKGIDPADVIYMGNDINDLPCFPLAGCAVVAGGCAARGAARRPTWC